MTDREFEQTYPWIDWREPVHVTVGNKQSYECRYCIAREGLRASDAVMHRYSYEQTREHITREHPA